ncbi:sulfotransferase family 2 domain-containing protein [Roseivirga sp. BDSF3-8]|uniref:sulfotransferase family 2 domain-containing protein n=1 Tax=Roseivirga sp. BDSF3-8 TaxID=3241598 RepID=UPI0035319820
MDKLKTENYPIIFTHVPRSGGTTLNSILKNIYPGKSHYTFYVQEKGGTVQKAIQDFKNLPSADKKQLKLLTGHTSFGIHEGIHEHPTYLTLLRDPVKRLISYYYYILGNDGHYLHQVLLRNRMALEEFLKGNLSTELDNIQVRQLSGDTHLRFGQCNEGTLEKAKANLDKWYPVFGITEKFDESLILFKEYFRWKSPYYIPLNTISYDKSQGDLANDTLHYILRLNQYDLALYEYASKRFNTMIQRIENFDQKLIRFQKANHTISKLGSKKRNYGLYFWNTYQQLLGTP